MDGKRKFRIIATACASGVLVLGFALPSLREGSFSVNGSAITSMVVISLLLGSFLGGPGPDRPRGSAGPGGGS
ncbi:hypothetical protein ACFV4N_18150 [Actinosynnema sp. NPDC059797]